MTPEELAESVNRLRHALVERYGVKNPTINDICIIEVQSAILFPEAVNTINALVELVDEMREAITVARVETRLQCYIDEYPEPTGKARKMFLNNLQKARTKVSQALTKSAPIAALERKE